jgi:hypothetical protein
VYWSELDRAGLEDYAVTVATAIVGGITQAAGTFMSGQQQADNYAAEAAANRYRAQVAKNNVAIAKANARFAQKDANRATVRGQEQAFRQDLETRQVLGEQVAQQGASGFDVGSASSTAVRDSTHMLGRMDSQQLVANASVDRFNAMIRKYNAQASAANAKAESGLYSMAAETAEANSEASSLASYINTASSLLGSASSISTKWGGGNPFSLGSGM